jgi:hypothetical protein
MKPLMPKFVATVLSATALLVALPAQAYSPAYNRAMVLGRAHGAAVACDVSQAKREEFLALSKKELSALATSGSDKSDADTRFLLDAVSARRSIESGNIACGDALWFWDDQLKALKKKHKSRK